MIKLIAGKKGTGKTKLLINAIHEAEQASNGNVVAIQIGSSLNIDIYHKVRLVNIEDYNIDNYDAMYGFIAGMLASDYDCTDIFVDGILKICGRDMEKVGGGYDWSQSNWDRRKLLSYTAEDAERDGYTFIDDINDSDGIYDYNNGDGYDY